MISIKEQTAKIFKEKWNIPPEITEEMFQEGAVVDHVLRNWLIRREYKLRAQPKEKQRVRAGIAERFCVSVKLIEKIVLE